MPASWFQLEPSLVSVKFALNRLDTLALVGVAVSSRSATRSALPEAVGASFTAVTLTVAVTLCP